MKDHKENRPHKITFRHIERELRFLDEFSESAGISRSDILRSLIKKTEEMNRVFKKIYKTIR